MPNLESNVAVTRVLVSATVPTQILGPNKRRLAVVFGCPATNQYWLSQDPAVAAGIGFQVGAANLPLIITGVHVGRAVGLPWFAISPLGAQTVFVQEYFVSEGPAL